MGTMVRSLCRLFEATALASWSATWRLVTLMVTMALCTGALVVTRSIW